MSLARVNVPLPIFDAIHSHLVWNKPPYRNMHLREARYSQKKRVLRYLHAIHAARDAAYKVEGVISGPDVFWQYELLRYKSRTQLNLIAEDAPPDALDRIERTFLPEILQRIREEQRREKFNPKRLSGQYYLIRDRDGSLPSHPDCKRAVAEGVLDEEFVEQLAPWALRLFRKP